MTRPTPVEADARAPDGLWRRLLRRWWRRRPAGSLGDLDPHLRRDLGLEPGPAASAGRER